MTQTLTTKPTGRPKKDEQSDIRERLFNAAKYLFGQYEYEYVSTRKIAERAETTPAMIRYYFGSKQGLHQTVVTDCGKKIITILQDINRNPELARLELFFQRFYQYFYLNDINMPSLLRRNMFNKENPELVEEMLAAGPKPFYALMNKILVKLQQKNEIRADLDCQLLTLQIMSLCSYPCMFNPMLGNILGQQLDQDFYFRLAKQNLQILLHSIQPEQ